MKAAENMTRKIKLLLFQEEGLLKFPHLHLHSSIYFALLYLPQLTITFIVVPKGSLFLIFCLLSGEWSNER